LGKQESTMENLEINSFWSGKRVLVTGHTGFKGSWLSFWLHQLGAEVFGVALEPETNPSLFGQLHLEKNIHHFIGDIRDEILIRQKIITIQPDIVFHLAAQQLVRRSYREPLLTWQTNVMGTANLLNALVEIKSTCAVVIVTTDKVWKYVEDKFRWRPSIFMPRWASRITLEIVNIRVERVGDISEADAIAEGIPPFLPSPSKIPIMQYATLWNRINQKSDFGWDVNPYVWVIEFKRV